MLPQGIVPALNMVCFSGFFSHRAMLLFWNNSLIGFPIIGKNNAFFISGWYAIPEYSAGVFAAITAGISNDFSGLSVHCNPYPDFVVRAKDKRP